MTSKHFKAIAHTLNANVAPLELVSDFADMCEEFNPLFNRQIFVEASTINLRAKWESEARIYTMETK